MTQFQIFSNSLQKGVLLVWIIGCVCGPAGFSQSPYPLTSPLDLLPTSNATHIVQNSGNWTDPGTWQSQSVPDNLAKVWIPTGKTLTVDDEITTRIKIIRIDGKLSFATATNTALNVETIIQSMNGELEIGTSTTPIAA